MQTEIMKMNTESISIYALYIDDEVRNYYSFGIKNIKIYKKRIEIEEVKIESPLDSGIFTD